METFEALQELYLLMVCLHYCARFVRRFCIFRSSKRASSVTIVGARRIFAVGRVRTSLA